MLINCQFSSLYHELEWKDIEKNGTYPVHKLKIFCTPCAQVLQKSGLFVHERLHRLCLCINNFLNFFFRKTIVNYIGMLYQCRIKNFITS